MHGSVRKNQWALSGRLKGLPIKLILVEPFLIFVIKLHFYSSNRLLNVKQEITRCFFCVFFNQRDHKQFCWWKQITPENKQCMLPVFYRGNWSFPGTNNEFLSGGANICVSEVFHLDCERKNGSWSYHDNTSLHTHCFSDGGIIAGTLRIQYVAPTRGNVAHICDSLGRSTLYACV